MARRNAAKEMGGKRTAIINAFIDSIISVGLDNASMGEVAKRVDLDRSTLHYYFRTREELIFATTDEIAQRYVTPFLARIGTFAPGERAQQLVEYLFGGDFHQPELSIVIEELGVFANGNAAIDRRVSGIYRAVERAIVAEIDSEFPEAPKRARLYVGYAISQLLEGYTVFATMKFGDDRRRAAHRAAMMLIESLNRRLDKRIEQEHFREAPRDPNIA